jgi:hypothetical protein
VKRLLGLLLATALAAAGCSSGGGSSDLTAVAAAIRELEQKGAAFTYTDNLVESGGSLAGGSVAQAQFLAAGVAHDDNVSLLLTELDSAGKTAAIYDLVINDSYLFVRPHGMTRAWYVGAAALANHFYPGVRLNLLRETVLLATKGSRATGYSNGAFLNQYTITAAPDQLVQLLSVTVAPDKESGFLKSAHLTIEASLTTSGHLQRLDLHAVGTDPASNLHRVFDSSMTFSRIGQVTDPTIPTTAVAVQPMDMFSTAATPTGP